MDSIKVTTSESNEVQIQVTLTTGKVYAIINALNMYKEKSSVAGDVLCLFRNAIALDAKKNPNSPVKDATLL
jgi:hypothetical protein